MIHRIFARRGEATQVYRPGSLPEVSRLESDEIQLACKIIIWATALVIVCSVAYIDYCLWHTKVVPSFSQDVWKNLLCYSCGVWLYPLCDLFAKFFRPWSTTNIVRILENEYDTKIRTASSFSDNLANFIRAFLYFFCIVTFWLPTRLVSALETMDKLLGKQDAVTIICSNSTTITCLVTNSTPSFAKDVDYIFVLTIYLTEALWLFIVLCNSISVRRIEHFVDFADRGYMFDALAILSLYPCIKNSREGGIAVLLGHSSWVDMIYASWKFGLRCVSCCVFNLWLIDKAKQFINDGRISILLWLRSKSKLLFFGYDDKNEICAICFESLHQMPHQYIIECGHGYHQDCLQEWFNTSINRCGRGCRNAPFSHCFCPTCRAGACNPANYRCSRKLMLLQLSRMNHSFGIYKMRTSGLFYLLILWECLSLIQLPEGSFPFSSKRDRFNLNVPYNGEDHDYYEGSESEDSYSDSDSENDFPREYGLESDLSSYDSDLPVDDSWFPSYAEDDSRPRHPALRRFPASLFTSMPESQEDDSSEDEILFSVD